VSPAGVSQAGLSHAAGKVLRNTYALLSLTLLFSALMAGVSMAINAPYGLSLVCSLVALGLLWFVVPRTGHSMAGIYVVFAVTGLLGFGLGPVLNMYISGFANGGQLIMMAFGSECTHMGADMVDGVLDALTVECPVHDSCYDIATGELIHGPGYGPLPVYEVREIDGDLQIAVE
jgi:nitrite reductase/ring-hydroxylating ferredoxin subunit